ncbi:hypothetical protein [Nocardioides sp. zg-DK7169]|uniref:hypothetical protein n=1 Tax=Nocardioides sp. zg-DK7169 TaxID=2736600 RepID=UPI001556BFC1|nr:hypothetical protein [Nocardioides sp. zg-DK7169]NPC97776.1 hypothetical protein [Nocardioides sp. zg-DK7169]
MTTIPVSETVPGPTGTAPAPQQPTSPSSPTPAGPTRTAALAAAAHVVRDIVLALLDLARLRTRSAWAEIRATSPAWFPVVLLTWCGVAAVLAAAFAIWVLVVMLTTG